MTCVSLIWKRTSNKLFHGVSPACDGLYRLYSFKWCNCKVVDTMSWCRFRLLVLGLLLLIVHINGDTCGTKFTDLQSSAILANVIFEGQITGKLSQDEHHRYNVTVKVLKIHKGKQLLTERSKKIRRATLGEFGPEDKNLCISEIDETVKKYIFFARNTDSDRFYQVTALPVKQGKKTSRSIRKILCRKCAVPPKIKPIKNQKKHIGQKAKFRCSGKAKPRAQFTWFKNGVQLTKRKGLSIKSGKRGSRLQINHLKTSDAGQYKCLAQNAAGQAEMFTRLEVKPTKQISHLICETQTYCFNGGTCHYIPSLQNTTFCLCPVEWGGRRCELWDHGQLTQESKKQAKILHDRTLIIIGIVIAVLVFIIICVASYFMSRRQRKKWVRRNHLKSKRNIPESSVPLLDDVDSSILRKPLKTNPPFIRPTVHKNTQTGNSLSQIFPKIEKQHESSLMDPPSYSSKENNQSIPLNHFLPSSKKRMDKASRSRLKAVSVDEPSGGIHETPTRSTAPTRSKSDPHPSWREDSNPNISIVEILPEITMQNPPLSSVPTESDATLDEIDYPAGPYTGAIYVDDPGFIDVHNMNDSSDEVPSPIYDRSGNPLLPCNSSDSESDHSPLPVLYISEEDVRTSLDDLQSLEINSGNVYDPSGENNHVGLPNGTDSDVASRDSSEDATSSSVASVRSPSYIMYNSYQDPVLSTRAWDEQGTPVPDHFAYNSVPNSDPNIMEDQFMHKPPVSPTKADDKYTVNNKLKDILDEQDAIPI